jgi:hypothetical protein
MVLTPLEPVGDIGQPCPVPASASSFHIQILNRFLESTILLGRAFDIRHDSSLNSPLRLLALLLFFVQHRERIRHSLFIPPSLVHIASQYANWSFQLLDSRLRLP